MAKHDDLKDPVPHAAPAKGLVDKVIDLALSAGGGAVTLLSGLLAAALILYSGYVLTDTFATESAASSNAWDLLKYKPEILDDYETPMDADTLADINRDYRAWLTVYETNIDYPVVQGPNDTYYAYRDIYNRPSITGAIYLAAGNSGDFSDSYNVIYGHHMDNGAMFGGLDNMTGSEKGLLVAGTDIYDVEFFAVVSTDAYENRIYAVGNRMDDVLDFLRSGGAGGVGVGTTVTYFNEDAAADAVKLVALSTCANAQTSGRLVVIGKMTKRIVMTEVTVAKIWDDADNQDGMRPESLTMTLSNGDTAVLNEDNGWKATLSVPKFDNAGLIRYTWTEENTTGYEKTGEDYDGETGTTTFTNSHTPAVTSLTVNKVWDDDSNRDGVRPGSVTAVLSDGTEVVLNGDNGWTATVDNLPVYSAGQEIEYTWTEKAVEGYDLSVEGGTLTNTHTPETTTLTVRKVWEDGSNQDGIRPASLTATLFGNGVKAGSVTLSEATGWTGSVSGLFVNEGGQPVQYRWEEESAEGYTSESSVNGTETVFTNTHIPATVDLTVSKVWDDNNDQDGIRPAKLLVTLSGGRSVTLNAGNGWSATLRDLPKYAAGVEIEYRWTEEDVTGYSLTGSVTTGASTVLTNRHETAATVATVTKVWNDDNNRDGIRPETITVTLSDGTEATLSQENNWTYTVTGIPVNANGKPIVYTWTEPDTDGYTSGSSVSGTTTTLTNTHSPETKNLTVVKVWDDNNDQDGKRPSGITVTLKADGKAVGDVTLNAGNSWTGTIENQPVRDQGSEISYSWDEEEVDGYSLTSSTAGNVTTLTNRHVPETAALTVKKVWNDNNNQDGIRPASLKVTLSDGSKAELNKANGWTAEVSGRPVYANGRPIVYSWTEEFVKGYELSGSETTGTVTTLTNTHTPAKTDLTVSKIWDDDEDRDRIRPSSLKVTLKADGRELNTAALNSANGWTAVIRGLPVYAAGQKIRYAWEEENVSGYGPASSTEGAKTTLTNTHAPATVRLTVKKVWDDDENRDALRPESLDVTLKGNDGSERTVTLTEAEGWTATLEVPLNLRGTPIEYAWSEAGISSYKGSQKTEGGTTTFTNVHAPALTRRTIVKVWDDADDQDGLRPEELTVTLLAGTETVQTVRLNEANGWTGTVENLPVYDQGDPIRYSWQEENVPDYLAPKNSENGTVTTITNKHEPAMTTLSVKKVWDDAGNQDGIRPAELTVRLLADGKEAGSVKLDEENGWSASIENLPVNAGGKPVGYAWNEGDIEGYELKTSTADGLTVLTNTHETERTVATVVKVWDDDGNRDGVRPESVTMTLSTGDQVVLSEENHWTATVENLPRNAGGKPVVYTWTEEEIPNYTETDVSTDGTVTTITNRHEIALVPVTVVKVWDDDGNRDGLRPEWLFVTLNGRQTVELNEENGWTATIEDQPVYTDEGRIIIYTWREPGIVGYTQNNPVTNNYVTTLTNIHEPETVNLTVAKVWDDNGNAAGGRPETVTVDLTAGGRVIETVRLRAGNGWRATVEDLPVYDQGRRISYAWTEREVPDYRLTGTVTAVTQDDTRTTLTNSREYTLTIRYEYADGGEAAPSVEEKHLAGEAYDVASPEIEGYTASLIRVQGTMPDGDAEYAVVYLPGENLELIEDPETALGLGDVFINMGDCIE